MKQIRVIDFSTLTARQLIKELDLHVLSQEEAKACLANLVCNRLRMPDSSKIAKNALLYGPNGVGKTLLIKTTADYLQLPFLHLSALSLFEDPVSKSIPNMMNKLINIVIKQRQEYWKEKYFPTAYELAVDKIAELILNRSTHQDPSQTLSMIKQKLKDNAYENTDVKVPIASNELDMMLHVPVDEALNLMTEKELGNLLNAHDFAYEALHEAEKCSIIALDDIDKICINPINNANMDYVQKLEVAQRRLIKLLEGTTVLTDYGSMDTHSIMFICCGTFSGSNINNLIPELQAHLSARACVYSLNKYDFLLILQVLDNGVLQEYQKLARLNGFDVVFVGQSLDLLAEYAFQLNSTEQNLGIRRLHLMLEFLFKTLLINADHYIGQTVEIDENLIRNLFHKQEIKIDYKKYIL